MKRIFLPLCGASLLAAFTSGCIVIKVERGGEPDKPAKDKKAVEVEVNGASKVAED